MYAVALSASGFDVVAAEDADDAYRRAWEIHPDIIVADLPMPNPERWPFLENLKQNPRTRAIPLVAMSGFVQRPVNERIDGAGFAAFFPKPCLPDELAEHLRQVLQGYADVPH
jgi:CheY-like chemotaxis protein